MIKTLLIALTSVSLLFSGCSNFHLDTTGTHFTANENVVANAEKTLRISKDTFDMFLHIEYDNRDLVKERAPQIHAYANYIRVNAPNWLISADKLKNAYKHGQVGLAELQDALNVLLGATAQANKYISQISTSTP